MYFFWLNLWKSFYYGMIFFFFMFNILVLLGNGGWFGWFVGIICVRFVWEKFFFLLRLGGWVWVWGRVWVLVGDKIMIFY